MNEPYEYDISTRPVYEAQPVTPPSGTPILVFGILSLAFAQTFYLAFLGIIFGAVSKSKLRSYLASGGSLTGTAKVGRILGKIGFILGIVLTCLFVVWLVVMIVVVFNSGSFPYDGWYQWRIDL